MTPLPVNSYLILDILNLSPSQEEGFSGYCTVRDTLNNTDVNIDPMQTPGRRPEAYSKAGSYQKKIPRSPMKLVSYSQRRTQYKKTAEIVVSQSIDDLNKITEKYKDMKSHRRTEYHKLRQIRKVEKQVDRSLIIDETDEDRQNELFGDLAPIDGLREELFEETKTRPDFRNTISYKIDSDKSRSGQKNPFDEVSSESEENFCEDNIEEHDDISTPKSNVQFHTNMVNSQRPIPGPLKHLYENDDSMLEVIKETEDHLVTPEKPQEMKTLQHSRTLRFNKPNPERKPVREEPKKQSRFSKLEESKSSRRNLRNTITSSKNTHTPKKRFGFKATSTKPTPAKEESPNPPPKQQKIPKALQHLHKPTQPQTSKLPSNPKNPQNTQKSLKTPKTLKTLKSSKTTKFSNPTQQIQKPTPQTSLKPKPTHMTKASSKPNICPSKPYTNTIPSSAEKSDSKNTQDSPSTGEKKKKIFKRKPVTNTKDTKKEEADKERKRKMMAERKLLLKKKISAIKIQKYWKARYRRRKMRLEYLRYNSAVRMIQRWIRGSIERIRERKRVVQYYGEYTEQITKIQREYRDFRAKPKKLNVKKFKSTLEATLIGWKVRRILAVLKKDKEHMEAIELTKLREDIKGQEDNLFFNQILEKLPEKFDMFHKTLDQMLESHDWPEKPVVK